LLQSIANYKLYLLNIAHFLGRVTEQRLRLKCNGCAGRMRGRAQWAKAQCRVGSSSNSDGNSP
jgi:hypothetical protein